MAALSVLPTTLMPRATEHIGEMIGIIARLIETGHAYEAEEHVLFHVPSDRDYGVLSRRDRDAMIAGARVEVASYKKRSRRLCPVEALGARRDRLELRRGAAAAPAGTSNARP